MRRASILLLFCFGVRASAEVRVASLFTDHMVLQRGTAPPVWGWAKSGEQIEVKGSWGKSAKTIAGADGKWIVRIPTGRTAGGPHTLTVSGENTLTFQDVMLGEVWLLSGQSNMEWSVGQVIAKAPKYQDTNAPNIRLFQVPNKRSSTPLENVDAKWLACTPETAKGFSAVGYFFARNVINGLGEPVPIGLIQSDWGGTEVEVWIREGALNELPGFPPRIEANRRTTATYQAELADWQKKVSTMEPGNGAFASPSFDDSGWKNIAGPKPWEEEGMGEDDGVAWYRAHFDLSLTDLVGPVTIELGDIDDADQTYINGKLVGETKVWNAKRKYTIPASALVQGNNVLAVRVVDTGGGGGFRTPNEIKLSSTRSIPLTNWKTKQTLSYKSNPPPQPPRWPAGELYNGMIAPVIPYAIKGALWYQGESNVSRAFQYRTTFPFLIQSWRKDWGQGDFPFYFVQIAPFAGYGSGASAELREAQLMTLKLKNTGMAVATDITDNVNDIHPVNKWDVGHRLALLALNRVYGKKQVDSGPIYQSHKVEGNQIRIFFEPKNSRLVMEAFSLPGLMIAGEDKKFVMAQARVDGNSLIVYSSEVPKPVAVRYGWSDVPLPGLSNEAKLPASPFRTDSWPGITEKNGW